MIHVGLRTQQERGYFLEEIKFKFVTIPQINPEQIMQIGDWARLKQTITELSGQESSWSVIEHKLEHLRQVPGESMLAYTQINIYNDCLTLYGIAPSSAVCQKTSRDVAKQFVKNVANRRVREVLIANGLSHDLVAITKLALEQDVLQQLDEPDLEVICMYCSKKGHRRRDCTARNKAIRESNVLSNDPTIRCTNCDTIGHSRNVCRVMSHLQLEQRRQNTNQANERNRNNQSEAENRNTRNDRSERSDRRD